MRSKSFAAISALSLFIILAAVASVAQRGRRRRSGPASQGKGVTLLPNGWRIQPAGRHLSVGDLPLAMVESPDGNHLVITNNGYAKPTLNGGGPRQGPGQLEGDARARLARPRLAPGRPPRLLVGRRPDDSERVLLDTGAADAGAIYALGRDTQKPLPGINRPNRASRASSGGIAISPDGRYVYAVHVLGRGP